MHQETLQRVARAAQKSGPLGVTQWTTFRLGERRTQELVEELGVALAATRLHALANQIADDLLVAISVLLCLVGAIGEHLVNDRLQRSGVAHLAHAARVHDLVGIIPALCHEAEHLMRLVGADGIARKQLG